MFRVSSSATQPRPIPPVVNELIFSGYAWEASVVEFVVKFRRSRYEECLEARSAQGTRTPQLLTMNWSAGEGMMVFAV